MHALHLLASLALLPLTFAAHITVLIPPSRDLSNPSTLPSTTHSTLFRLDNTLTTPLTRRNTFEFTDVTPGSYLFTIQCRDYTFAPYRVDVTTMGDEGRENVEVWQTFWGNEWGNKGERIGGSIWEESSSESVRIEARVERVKNYYQERQGFDPLSFLKSPMILMALFSLVLIVGMPYLTESSKWCLLRVERLRLILIESLQWTRRQRRSLQRYRQVGLWERRIKRMRCRTLIWRAGWLGRVLSA